MTEVTKTTTAVAMLVAATVAAPGAGARPADYPLPTGADTGPVAVTRTVEVRSNDFDWGDAGLGAAGMLSLLGLGTGAVVIGRRGRRGHPTVG